MAQSLIPSIWREKRDNVISAARCSSKVGWGRGAANFDNGVSQITLPKLPEAEEKAHKIAIT